MHTIFKGTNRIEVIYGVYGAKSGRNHKGMDIDTLPGEDTTVHSTVTGKVEFAGFIPKGPDRTWEWGWHVRIIEAGRGYRHTFAHCEEKSLLVKAGDLIVEGQPLAKMGKTGNASGDKQAEHVHYQVDSLVNGIWISMNPMLWAGGNNTPKNWPGYGYETEDDSMYRLYQVIYASLDKKAAIKQFNELLESGSRVGFDRAGSDGRYRIGKAVMAVEQPSKLFDQIDENYFIG